MWSLLSALLSRRLGPGASVPMHLPAGELRTLRGAGGRWLQVRRGRVWLTMPGDSRDHFLGPGQACRIEVDGPVLIQADGGRPASCRLQDRVDEPDWSTLDDRALRDIGLDPSRRGEAAQARTLAALRRLLPGH